MAKNKECVPGSLLCIPICFQLFGIPVFTSHSEQEPRVPAIKKLRHFGDHSSIRPTQNELADISSLRNLIRKKAQWGIKMDAIFLSLPPAWYYRGPA